MDRIWAIRIPPAIAAVFMAMAAFAALALVHLSVPQSSVPPGKTAPHKPRPAPAPSKPASAKTVAPQPSVFAQEQAMSFAELMNRWDPMVAEASKRFGVPKTWLRAVMRLESGGRTMLAEGQPIKSSMGAMGLMQLMPQTYDEMRSQYGLGADPYDPHDNIFAAAAYLRWLRGKYGYPAMFAAYNDGPGNLEARMEDADMLPLETQLYVMRITGTPLAARSALLTRRVGAPKRVRFTRPDGSPVYIDINAGPVVSVRAALPGEYAPGVHAVVTVGRFHQGVGENVRVAQARIRSHGGML